MPIYQEIKTYKSGYYNHSAALPRKYNAEDMSNLYIGLFKNGVKPAEDGTLGSDLAVKYVSGMTINVAIGSGFFGNKFFINQSAYNITLDQATASNRYDCIIIHADSSEAVKDTSIIVKSLDHVPTINDLIRNDIVNEYCLAYITVAGQSSSISQSVITDMRASELCGLICGAFEGFDSDELYTQFTAAFNEWFESIKDNLVANATLIRYYSSEYITTAVNEKNIPIGISQYDKNLDSLIVYVNGLVLNPLSGYTITSNSQVQLTLALPVIGTKVQFEVFKSINGSQANSVVQEVGVLQNQMTAVENKVKYYYYCNGVNDNVQISNIVKNFLNSGNDYGTMKLNVIGTLGMTAPTQGDGTSNNPYTWFDFNIQSSRKVIVDFSSCGQIAPTITDSTYNVVFHSNNNMHVIGANVVAANTATNTIIRISNTTNGVVLFENCRFYITGYKDSLIALRGTFNNCRGSVANVTENSYCFLPASNSVVKINGGEYYAYTGDSNKQSAIVGQSGADAVSILYGVSAPTSARTGYYQTNSLIQYVGGGMLNCTDLISELPLVVTAGISNIRGTITKSKPNVL